MHRMASAIISRENFGCYARCL